MSGLPFQPEPDPFLVPQNFGGSTVSAPTPITFAFTLPSNGIWLVAAYCRLQGAQDHMMSALYQVIYCNATSNDTLVTNLIGTVSKSAGSSFSLTNLTCSTPTEAGTCTLTASWSFVGDHTGGWSVSARRMLAL